MSRRFVGNFITGGFIAVALNVANPELSLKQFILAALVVIVGDAVGYIIKG